MARVRLCACTHACTSHACAQDDERLYANGQAAVYHISLDAEGTLLRSTFGSFVNGTTLLHSTFGAECILRVDVPEELKDASGKRLTVDLKQKAIRTLESTLANGIELFGLRYRPTATKSDQNQRDTKLYCLGEAPDALQTRDGWHWTEAAAAVNRLAAFSELLTTVRLLAYALLLLHVDAHPPLAMHLRSTCSLACAGQVDEAARSPLVARHRRQRHL